LSKADITGSEVITTVAGIGVGGFSGDGGPATSELLALPMGVALDARGNLFIADTVNHRIRKVAAGTGIITTVAGTGRRGFAVDGGPATSAQLDVPRDVAVDGAGNLFIADSSNHRIRLVVLGTGTITTVAGTGIGGFSGDGGPAASAELHFPAGLALDAGGNLLIADGGNDRIRKVAAGTGLITTVAGTGTPGFNGDNQPATRALLFSPGGLALDAAGNVLFADVGNHRIRKVAAGTGLITTVAGTGTPGFNGDNQPATSAQLDGPSGVALDPSGNLFIADTVNHRIRKVAAGTGIITTVVGMGIRGSRGDGGPAGSASLDSPRGVALDPPGSLFIADTGNSRIRKVQAGTFPVAAVLTVSVAGNGTVSGSGIACPGDCSETFTGSPTVTLTAIPDSGSSFGGWSGDCMGTGLCTVTMTVPRAVTATFAAITPLPTPTPVPTATPPGGCAPQALGPGTVAGTLTDADCAPPSRSFVRGDLYMFQGATGQVVTIRMESTAFDTYLILVGPGGLEVARNDDSEGTTNSLISNFTLPQTGSYIIEATAFSSDGRGSYTLSLAVTGAPLPPRPTPTPAGPAICPDTPPAFGSSLMVSRARARAGDTVTFSVGGTVGETAAVAFSRSNSGASYLGQQLLLGPDLRPLFACELAGLGSCSQSISIPPSISGTFFFQAARSSDPTLAGGTFSLTNGACLTIE
jgi:sugar lactone lactonase YvrE